MKRITAFILLLLLLSPAACALTADAIDADALDEAIARVNISLREAGNPGRVAWVPETEDEGAFIYFTVALPYDEITTGRYAGEVFATPMYTDREISFFYCLDFYPTAPWILIESTSFSREEIVPGVTMDGKAQDVDWQYYDAGDSVSLYLFPDEEQVTRWMSANELTFSFLSGNRTVYVTVAPETYARVYDLYSALMGCVRYANRDANAYKNTARLPAFPAAAVQEMPASGTTTLFTRGIASCFVTVSAPRGDDSYYVVFAQPDEPHAKLAAVLIQPGDTAKIKLPEGEYAVYYAHGTEWYGDYALFGADTQYYALDKTVSVRLGTPATAAALIAIPDENTEIDPTGFPF